MCLERGKVNNAEPQALGSENNIPKRPGISVRTVLIRRCEPSIWLDVQGSLEHLSNDAADALLVWLELETTINVADRLQRQHLGPC